jgi:type IV pilus assembly protein PilA
MRSSKKGFTLIELLIVIGILGILAAIILVAVDPAKRLKQARNARRYAEVNALLNAILNYTVDNRGTLPSAISSATAVQLGTSATLCDREAAIGCDALNRQGILTPKACADLSADPQFVDAYIASIPIDPKGSDATGTALTAARTGYYLMRSTNGRITVGSCNAEDEGSGIPDISVKR